MDGRSELGATVLASYGDKSPPDSGGWGRRRGGGGGGGWRLPLLLPKETVAKSDISVVIPTNLIFMLKIVFIYVHAEIHRNIEHFTKLLIKRLPYK